MTRRRIDTLARSIETLRASVRALSGLSTVAAFALAFALGHWWREVQGDWFRTLLALCAIGTVVSGFVSAARFAKLLPWLEQRLAQLRQKAHDA